MDTDIRFAIEVQANDHGIFDEELIDRLVSEYMKNNCCDVEEIINDTFDTNFLDTGHNIQFSIGGNGHATNVTELNTYRNSDYYEEINSREQRQLLVQLGGLPAVPSFFSLYNQFTQGQFPDILNNIFGTLGTLGTDYAPVRVTMTQESLDKLIDMSYEQVLEKVPNLDKDEKCAICWSKLSDKITIDGIETYKVLPCNHVFHSECITEELSNYSYICPTCKAECGDHEAKIDN